MKRRSFLGVGFLIVGACGGSYGEGASATNGEDAGASGSVDAGSLADVDAGSAPGPCGTGLTRVDGGACGIVNPFTDPSFQGAPADAWTYLAEAKLLASTPGPSDLGVARLTDPTVQSTKLGGVRQTITVPTFATAGPLAFEAIVRTNGPDANLSIFAGGREVGAPPIIGSFAGAETTRSLHRCIGEAGYGTTTYEIFARSANAVGATFGDLDSVARVSDPTCPVPGVVANGDFEGASAWTVAGQASIENGVGTAKGRGAQFRPNPPTGSSISRSISVPSEVMLAPALKLRTYGDGALRVSLDGFQIASLQSDVDRTEQLVCFPVWARGAVGLLKIDGSTSGTLAIDDVAIVDEASCTGAADPRNGDFESAKISDGWLVSGDVARRTNGSAEGLAHVAISGCTTESTFFASSITQTVAYPQFNQSGEGTGLVYKFKYAPGSGTTATVGGKEIAPNGMWQSGITCLPQKPAGFRMTISASVSYFGSCTPGTLEPMLFTYAP